MTNRSEKIPVRTCVVCREEKNKKDLLRIARDKEGNVLIDKTFKAGGRGAYVCKNPECVLKLKKTGALNRALKTAVSEEILGLIQKEVDGIE